MRFRLLASRGPLAVIFATAFLSVIATAVIDYWGLVRLDQIADGRRGDGAFALAAEDLREDVLELRRYEKDIFMNIGTGVAVEDYKAKWDRALLQLRYDLVRARSAGSTSQSAQLQEVTDWIATYRQAFTRIYDSISEGTIRTTQQANETLGQFKIPVRSADQTLAALSQDARERMPGLDPAVVAHRLGLALCLILFCMLVGLFMGCLRAAPSAGFA